MVHAVAHGGGPLFISVFMLDVVGEIALLLKMIIDVVGLPSLQDD